MPLEFRRCVGSPNRDSPLRWRLRVVVLQVVPAMMKSLTCPTQSKLVLRPLRLARQLRTIRQIPYRPAQSTTPRLCLAMASRYPRAELPIEMSSGNLQLQVAAALMQRSSSTTPTPLPPPQPHSTWRRCFMLLPVGLVVRQLRMTGSSQPSSWAAGFVLPRRPASSSKGSRMRPLGWP